MGHHECLGFFADRWDWGCSRNILQKEDSTSKAWVVQAINNRDVIISKGINPHDCKGVAKNTGMILSVLF